jgi:hypothetical protein
VFLSAWAAFGHALGAVFEQDSGLCEVDDVSAEPSGSAVADLVEDGGVDHRGFGEEAWASVFGEGRGEVGEVAVEEES